MSINEDENSVKINLLSKSYILHKRKIREAETQVVARNYEELRVAHKICDHIENVANELDDKEKLIIESEVLKGKTGRWYDEYFSAPSYYRIRKKAYSIFLNSLEKWNNV